MATTGVSSCGGDALCLSYEANPGCLSLDPSVSCEPPTSDPAGAAGISMAAGLTGVSGITLIVWGSIRIHRSGRELRRLESLRVGWWQPPSIPGARGLTVSGRF